MYKKMFSENSNRKMVVERVVFVEVKLKNFMEKSIVIMLAWVVDLMWKSLMLNVLGLLYYDNLIKCDTNFNFKTKLNKIKCNETVSLHILYNIIYNMCNILYLINILIVLTLTQVDR